LSGHEIDREKHKREYEQNLTKGKFHFLNLTGGNLLTTVREEKTEEAGKQINMIVAIFMNKARLAEARLAQGIA
jgi:hypothetical protein